MKKAFLLFGFCFLLNIQQGLADVGDWKTFTSSKDIRQIVVVDSFLWCATNGGVVRLNATDNSIVKYTNTEGLTDNNVVAIEKDNMENIWAAMSNGDVHVIDPVSDDVRTITDYHNNTITDMFALGDSVFIALDLGLSLYDKKRWEVKETYRSIGSVNSVFIDGLDIWAATETGIKKARLDFPNLMAPAAWTSFTVQHGLPDNSVLTITRFNDKIIAGTAAGVVVYEDGVWNSVALQGTYICDFAFYNGDLIATSRWGVYKTSDLYSWTGIGSGILNIADIDVAGETIWVGHNNDAGLSKWDDLKKQWISVIPDGPSDNKFSALLFDADGDLWTASNSGGISYYNGAKWQVFSTANGKLTRDDWRDLELDPFNRIWAGSWGGGVVVFEKVTQDSISISQSVNDNLTGISSNPNYIVVTDLLLDNNNLMWIVNSQASNKRVLAVTDFDQWNYFSVLDGINSDHVSVIDVDASGRKWIGTESIGLRVLDDNNTPFDKSDDNLNQGLSTSDGLESNDITSLAGDYDNIMWIGTPQGLSYWFDGTVTPQYNVINDDITCVKVDVRNNKWVGTNGGLSMLSADGYTWTHYSTSNSPIVSDNIVCFAFNENNGQVFIGTTNGLSSLETPYTKPSESLDNLVGYPNPFILDGSLGKFYIDQLAKNSTVRIYTPEGYLVKNIPSSQVLGARAIWDGTNDSGELVASGVYVYVVVADGGLAKTGKVAVIKH